MLQNVMRMVVYYTLRAALSLRYRVTVKGLDKITRVKAGGFLVLPNHPTLFVDPVLMVLMTWKKIQLRPLIVEYMYYMPGVYGVMRLIRAMPVPNFSASSNSFKRNRIEKGLEVVKAGLRKGDNFLLYPAGRVKQTHLEVLGGASATHRLVQEVPEVNVVLVRISGLWGSSFSKALTGQSPSLFGNLWKGVKIVMKNLIFFTPRREVVIEFFQPPADFPYHGSRLEFNRYLENFYNQPAETLSLVSYSMWGEVLPEVKPETSEESGVELDKIPDSVKERVIAKIAEMTELDQARITPQMHLAQDVGLDSLDAAELVAFVSETFGVGNVPPNELTTVGKLMAIAAKQIVFQDEGEEEASIAGWNQKLPHERVTVADGKTMPEVFLNNCKRRGSAPACGDLRAGVMSYKTVKLRAILLADYIKKLPGDRIGIMLPSSVGATIVTLATQLAGKVPVMINWTVGPRHLEAVKEIGGIKVVLSSWAFLDKLPNVELNGLEDLLVILEEARTTFTLRDKLRAAFLSKCGTARILRHFSIQNKSENDPAVILFTSGTESMPKGVPLSHRNILSNQRSIFDVLDIYTDDVLFAILPPFHSFGFTVSSTLCMMAGFRVAFFPNPTDGKKLAEGVEKWGVTIVAGAPTFLRGMLRAARPE